MFPGLRSVLSGGRYTAVDGERVYAEVRGAGPPVVLIHGLGGSQRWWSRNIAALARNHELHMVDLAGCGRSSGRFVLARAAERLAAWMRCCGLARASLIGHSMGGYVAASLAAHHSGLVDRLVLVDAALPVAGPIDRRSGRFRSPLPASMLPMALGDMIRTGVHVIAWSAHEMFRADMGPTLASVLADTLLVWGEHDNAVPIGLARAAMRHLPSARLAVIGDAGHVPMWEQPEAFHHAVLSFLAGRPITPEVFI